MGTCPDRDYHAGHFTLFTIAPHIAWNNVEGELALFDSRDGTYHALNGSAAAIWRELASGLRPDEIVDRLARRHAAEPDVIARHVSGFVETALHKGLLARVAETD